MGLTRTADPAVEPVSLDEVKDILRIDHTTQDSMLDILIKSARIYVENQQKRQHITATYEYTLDGFPAGDIIMPKPPLIAVASISYKDLAGDTQTWAVSKYQVVKTSLRGTISPEPNVSYPTTETGRKDAITITFNAGYGAAASNVPEDTRLAIMMLAAHWHQNPEPVAVGESISEIPMHVQNLIDSESLKYF